MTGEGAVLVVFQDAASGAEIARANLPPDQLPDAFQRGMTVTLGDSEWYIERAEPAGKAEFVAGGRLALAVSRIGTMSPNDILFSLPTISEELPAMDAAAPADGRLELHEDDWRSAEFVQRSVLPVATAELDRVRRIYVEHAEHDAQGRVVGFTTIHRRREPERPLPAPLALERVRGLLPPPSATYPGFAFRGAPGVVRDGFAQRHGPVVLYGRAPGGTLAELCLLVSGGRADAGAAGLADALAAAMTELELVLVDWNPARLIAPESIGSFLTELGIS